MTESDTPVRQTSRVRRAVFVAILFLGAVVLAEALARLVVITLRGPITFRTDALLGFAYRPNLSIHRVRDGCDWRFHTDEHGHRVVPGNPSAEAAPTVVLLGDSFLFGDGVDDADTCAAFLARHGYHVVNLAVTGYGPQQQLISLRKYLADGQKADWVVSFTYTNDARDVVSTYQNMHHQPTASLCAGTLTIAEFAPPLSDVIVHHSYLCAVVRGLLLNQPVRLPGDAPQIIAGCLSQIEKEAQRSGAQTLFLAHDAVMPHEITPVVEAIRQAGIPVIDLSPEFQRRIVVGDDLICPDGMHWNRAGSELVATAVVERIERHAQDTQVVARQPVTCRTDTDN